MEKLTPRQQRIFDQFVETPKMRSLWLISQRLVLTGPPFFGISKSWCRLAC
jgi:hypothetical protein